jgi:hypothetical protein
MASTFTLIETVTVGSGGAGTISFSSIPQTYTDLVLWISGRGAASFNAESVFMRFNGSTSNYSSRVLYGETTGAGSFSPSEQYCHIGYITASNTTANNANTFGNVQAIITDYTSTAKKTVSADSVKEGAFSVYQSGIQSLNATTWNGGAAVTSIALTTQSGGNYAQNTTASLYGVKKA